MTYKTLKGYTYVVTAVEDVTVTDSNGLVLVVPAGEQRTFVASTTEVDYSAPCTIIQVRGNFSLPSTGGGGGGQITIDPTPTQGSPHAVSSAGVYDALRELPAPVPTALTPATAMKHGGVYTLAVTEDTTLSALGVEQYGTAELWIDYTAGSVDFTGTGWVWVTDGDAPASFTAGKRYCIALRNDGTATLANLQYEYTTPAQS